MSDARIDRLALLEAENAELRERVILLERSLTADLDRLPIGGLTQTEAVVLATIQASPDGASKNRIFNAVYALRGDREQPEIKIIDIFVCKLRKKLAAHGIGIETVWGWGYRMSRESRERLQAMREAVR